MASGSVQRSARHHFFRRRDADAPSFSAPFYAITIGRACATLCEGDQPARRCLAIKLQARKGALFQLLRGSPTRADELVATILAHRSASSISSQVLPG
ncbi:MAG: hypothetical protein RLZZ450_7751 [Pseudomonadota bacterium]|jgi:hypothetical protein